MKTPKQLIDSASAELTVIIELARKAGESTSWLAPKMERVLLDLAHVMIPDGARDEGGDLVIDSQTAEFAGFMTEPDRVIIRFDGFDVIVPDAAAHNLLRQLRSKLRTG